MKRKFNPSRPASRKLTRSNSKWSITQTYKITLTLTLRLNLTHGVHQNAPRWQKIYMCTSGSTLRIIFIFLTQKCTKWLLKMSAKFWDNIVHRFLIDEVCVKLAQSRQKQKRTGSNRVKAKDYNNILHLKSFLIY